MPLIHDVESWEQRLAALPLASYGAGATVFAEGTRTGQLFILKSGAVRVVKNGTEIARVAEPGAILGELSALLDQPHTADVCALEDSQFHVADAALPEKDPVMLLHVSRILGRRIVAANRSLVQLKKQIQAGQSPSVLRKMLEKMEKVLNVGGIGYEV